MCDTVNVCNGTALTLHNAHWAVYHTVWTLSPAAAAALIAGVGGGGAPMYRYIVY